ncbi:MULTISPECIES: polysaccharide pyruvyl transferase family protein [Microvirga]|uniref:polysaccharide pyruvyl transferase family protein n=1 Tax=Microvirga TaxID=186650 RepID=UPI001B358FE4|nr:MULTISPECIES: polysaccharide pyruvyl transferase family protein [unclassified Microvirga]MBQ0820655.1 polysaccharide pyruvyl transferase family protein [Microvirga sp. HBU67558]
MKRLFVLNGGAAVKPGNKAAYLKIEDPLVAFENRGINTGDVLVYDAMLKALNYDQITNLQFAHAANVELWPQEHCDATVIRGSNYLAENVDLGHVAPLLKKLPGPIVPIGVGAQTSVYKKLAIPRVTAEAWRIIADKCETIGVRGFYSAEVFNDLGIKNVRVIGCPSFYRSLLPSIDIKPIDPTNARVGLTLNKYLSADYATNATKTNRIQRALIGEVAKRASSRLYSQGEREETLAIYSSGKQKQDHVRSILSKFNLVGHSEAERLLSERMVAFFDVDQWANDAASHVDFMMGFRLHGNVIALHQGIPSVFFTYDSRIRELASLFAVPSIEVEDYMPVDLEALLEKADFSKFQHVYPLNYAEYYRFLTENRLSHVLAQPLIAPADNPLSVPNSIEIDHSTGDLIGWFRSEIDSMTSEIELLRSRAWNLEVKLRSSNGLGADGAAAKSSVGPERRP